MPMATSSGRSAHLAVLALVLSLLLGGVALGASSRQPYVWIDTPLDGSVIAAEQGIVTVVGHVTAPGGIDRTRLIVDGERLAAAPLEADAGRLLTVEFDWEPNPGTHVLELWARNEDGDWEGPAIATVIVEGDPEPPPSTVSPSTSAAPTTSSTPSTSGACLFEPPDLVSPVDGRVTPLTANTLTWLYSGCRPALEFEVEVSTTPNFIEIFASALVQETSWLTPNLLCDTYWWRVRAQSFDDTVAPWSAAWSYTISFRGC